MTVLVVTLAVVVGLLAVLVAGLLRSHAEILRALHDLGVNMEEGAANRDFAARPPATVAPTTVAPTTEGASGLAEPRPGPLPGAHDLRGVTPRGDALAVGVAGADRPTLLAFLSSGCITCMEFWDALADHPHGVPGVDARVVAVTKGPDAESPAAVARVVADDVQCIMSTEAFEDYGVSVAPYFVLVDGHRGVVGEGAARSWDQLADLLAKAAADGALPSAGRPTRRDVLSGRSRRRRIDDELTRAGIQPGDPSLYEDPHAEDA